jgi:hypothetical protein
LDIHRKCKGLLDVGEKNSRMMGGQFPLPFSGMSADAVER